MSEVVVKNKYMCSVDKTKYPHLTNKEIQESLDEVIEGSISEYIQQQLALTLEQKNFDKET